MSKNFPLMWILGTCLTIGVQTAWGQANYRPLPPLTPAKASVTGFASNPYVSSGGSFPARIDDSRLIRIESEDELDSIPSYDILPAPSEETFFSENDPSGISLLPEDFDGSSKIFVEPNQIKPFQLSSHETPWPSVQKLFVQQANQSPEGASLLSPFSNRALAVRAAGNQPTDPRQTTGQGRPEFHLWWTHQVSSPAGLAEYHLPISIDSLIKSALYHSPHIQIAATKPHIQKTNVFEEASEFDWRTFLETEYDDQNDPIGNTLTTGNNDDRFRQQEWNGQLGARRKNRIGGEVELSQKLGYLNNNSRFLIPPNQGNSRLELNYRQPLMNGRGRAVNESLILLAEIDYLSASDDFMKELQTHLLNITVAYWELVRSRAEYLQRKKLLRGAESILANLQDRTDIDVIPRQILRAKSAVTNRRAEIARALASIKNAESQLRLLVNDPALVDAIGTEFTPLDSPMTTSIPINMGDALSTALANRPDISKAIRQLKAANVRLGVARNDILPKLDLLVGTYVAGLDGDSDVLNSWVNQYRDGRPGFRVGLEFELPIGNRAALARKSRRSWEAKRTLHQFRAVVESSLTEVELAVREVNTTHQEMFGRYDAILAAEQENEFLLDRWQTLPGIDDSVTLLLENILDSQERIAEEEAAFVQAQADYSVAVVKLKQAMGTLFQADSCQFSPAAFSHPSGF